LGSKVVNTFEIHIVLVYNVLNVLSPQELDEHEAVAQSLRTLKLVEGVLRKHSPVIIIQRAWRGRLNKRRANEFRELRHW